MAFTMNTRWEEEYKYILWYFPYTKGNKCQKRQNTLDAGKTSCPLYGEFPYDRPISL
jgi:hypothetical protein